MRGDGVVDLGAVRLRLACEADEPALAFTGVGEGSLDGLAVRAAVDAPREPATAHPNAVSGVDHVVVATPDLDRTLAALGDAGFALRREGARGDLRQAFFVVGPCLLEVVGPSDGGDDGPAALWGVTLVSDDLEATARAMGGMLGEPHDAVQPGRRIATVRREARLGTRVAVMTPR